LNPVRASGADVMITIFDEKIGVEKNVMMTIFRKFAVFWKTNAIFAKICQKQIICPCFRSSPRCRTEDPGFGHRIVRTSSEPRSRGRGGCGRTDSGSSRYRIRVPLAAAATASEQGCQMFCFQTENSNLGKFWTALEFGIFYDHLVYFMSIW
jgi:hypothetical protein